MRILKKQERWLTFEECDKLQQSISDVLTSGGITQKIGDRYINPEFCTFDGQNYYLPIDNEQLQQYVDDIVNVLLMTDNELCIFNV